MLAKMIKMLHRRLCHHNDVIYLYEDDEGTWWQCPHCGKKIFTKGIWTD